MPTPFTPQDLLRFAVPTEMALSPNERYLAYTLLTQDAATDTYRSAIWRCDLHDPAQPHHQLTAGTHRDRSPAWSPDGRQLAFVSNRTGTAQIWLLPSDGGEARQITWMRWGAARPCWSPDGDTILFLAEVREGATSFLAAGETTPPADTKKVQHITRLQYRWDGSAISEGRTHIWHITPMPLANALPSTAWSQPQQLTTGDYDHAYAVWSPDGSQIAFVSDRDDDRDANTTNAIWVLTVASGVLHQVSSGKGEAAKPLWSPDGKHLAWYEIPSLPEHSFSNQHIYMSTATADSAWQAPRDLLEGQDSSVGDTINGDVWNIAEHPLQWGADSLGLYTTMGEHGLVHLGYVPVDGQPVRLSASAMQAGLLIVPADQRSLLALITTSDRACDIAQFSLDDTPATAPIQWITDANPWLHEKPLNPPEEFSFTAPDGWQIQGWIQWPIGAADSALATERWPVVLLIHGGPHGFYGPIYSHQRHILLDAGYAVVFINPRGSKGYGETFARACDRDWGGADYQDIMAGLEAALAHGRLDADRMAVMGASYGGYMTNWIISHTDRFKAAITINSVTNLISIFGTGDIDATLGIPEYGGTLWERWDYFVARSPITYAPSITTPTRVIGSEQDWRCPIEQSEQFYTALKLLGRAPTDFIRIPNVSHAINKGTPQQRIALRQATLDWLARYLPAPDPIPIAPP